MSMDLEQQIRTLADAAFEQTSPVQFVAPVPERVAAGAGSTRWWLLVAASVLVIALIGGITMVGGFGDSPVAPANTSAPATTPVERTTTEPLRTAPDFSSEFSARGVLGVVPLPDGDPATGLSIGGADFAAIAELAGIDRTGGLDRSLPSDWLGLLLSQESAVLPESALILDALDATVIFESEFGFSVLDVDRFATASNYLGASVDSRLFPFDVLVLGSDMAALAESAGDDSIVDIGEGADHQRNVAERTVFRPIGEPLRVGIDASRSMAAVSRSTPFVEAWLETDGKSLADVPDLAAAAAVLDRDDQLHAVQFEIFNRDVDDLEPEITQEPSVSDFLIGATRHLISEEFTTMALGSSGIGESNRTTIVYVFADERSATASVEPIERLYARDTDIRNADIAGAETVGDVFTLDEVTVVGRSVAVSGRAGAGGPSEIRRLLQNLTLFVTHR